MKKVLANCLLNLIISHMILVEFVSYPSCLGVDIVAGWSQSLLEYRDHDWLIWWIVKLVRIWKVDIWHFNFFCCCRPLNGPTHLYQENHQSCKGAFRLVCSTLGLPAELMARVPMRKVSDLSWGQHHWLMGGSPSLVGGLAKK